ncbi:MAG: helix-hairpin-helix domain-containing protein [bacterium]
MFSDLLKIIKSFKKYRVESTLIVLSIFITLISLFMLLAGSQEQNNNISVKANQESKTNSEEIKTIQNIIVDVSGAINRPGIYELNNGSRINDAIQMAGGLSYEADKKYFYRNYNLSSYVYDQEKLYIPYYWEITSGIFIENPRILNYLSAIPTIQSVEPTELIEKININEATIDELDELPGIGAITAQKIIQNRPYSAINDLLSKKIVNSGVFENIKSEISIN